MIDFLLIVLCGALLLFLVLWMLFAVVCFSKASAETTDPEPDICEESEPGIQLIGYAVEHLKWKSKRGYCWGGGYKYDD